MILVTRLACVLLVSVLAGAGMAWGDDMPIAVVSSMSGANAAYGEQMQRGAVAAVKDINAQGGVLGKQLKLLVGDDACDAEQAVSAARQMVAAHAQLVIGGYCSGASIPASEVYNQASLLQISPGSTNPTFTERGLDNVYRLCGRDDQQVTAAADYIVSRFKGLPIAIVDDKSVFGKGIAEGLLKALHAAGVNETLEEEIDAGEVDFSALVTKLKQFNTVAVYYGGYQTEAGHIVKQMRAAGLNSQFVAGDALSTKEFWQIAGPAAEGVVMTSNPDPRNNPLAKDVVAEFHREHYDPEGYTLYAYAAVQVFAQAVDKAKSTALADLNKIMHGGSFKTILGDISFDAKGDVVGFRYALFKWHNGGYSQF